ncbi:18S rRNA pseudouridine methyltransferase [Mycoemilia scoparia]|uniref:18S rRNA pseudouridine methyltransferase n=1 Tax=Mycoemilia scoparia TaxID=417184 RepID=A0A9W7ZTD2_9FUNG|nr:18S rRNA pseudouridine methyltransferase [Mycoemilia scoparia]
MAQATKRRSNNTDTRDNETKRPRPTHTNKDEAKHESGDQSYSETNEKQEEQKGFTSYRFVNANERAINSKNMVPRAPQLPKTLQEKDQQQRLIVILEAATLEIYKVGKNNNSKYQLLNCDDHLKLLGKLGRDITTARPDITHQVTIPQ